MNFENLVGMTFTSVYQDKNEGDGNDAIVFIRDEGKTLQLSHFQDCCESVYIESIVGDLTDLIGSPILRAEESSNSSNVGEDGDSQTWTFYKLATAKGYVDIRFYGSSNGYYSESVYLLEVD